MKLHHLRRVKRPFITLPSTLYLLLPLFLFLLFLIRLSTLPLSPTSAPSSFASNPYHARLSTLLHHDRPPNPRTDKQFVLYRALGNSLPKRHDANQTYRSLDFMLRYEYRPPNLERRWYLNRIIDPERLYNLVKLLRHHGEVFYIDQFHLEGYPVDGMTFEGFGKPDPLREDRGERRMRMLEFMMHHQNIYAISNNLARNNMLRLAFEAGAEYALPWDGNCFLNKQAWHEIESGIRRITEGVRNGSVNASAKYFVVPMARMLNNTPLLTDHYRPKDATEEPQIVFHKSANLTFNPHMRYGHRPKVDLLWRLGVSGGWDNWSCNGPFDICNYGNIAADVGGKRDFVKPVGWVARLFSGVGKLESGNRAIIDRGLSRGEGIEAILAKIGGMWVTEYLGFSSATLLFYDQQALQRNVRLYQSGGDDDAALRHLVSKLLHVATSEMQGNATYSVVHKKKTPPSGDMHDFYSMSASCAVPERPAEYKLPYVPKSDVFSDAEIRDYDMSRWRFFARNVTALTLAHGFEPEKGFAGRAARLVRVWFLDNDTRMNPGLKYACAHTEARRVVGTVHGVLEMFPIVYVLDMIRMLRAYSALSDDEMARLAKWFSEYAAQLTTSPLGKALYLQKTHHALVYDAQLAAVYAFVDDFLGLLRHSSYVRGRLLATIGSDGVMKYERGSRAAHDTTRALTVLAHLAQICARIGLDMWGFAKKNATESLIRLAYRRYVPYFHGSTWAPAGVGAVDMERMVFLFYQGQRQGLQKQDDAVSAKVAPLPQRVFEAKPDFEEDSLIPPFWNLGFWEGKGGNDLERG